MTRIIIITIFFLFSFQVISSQKEDINLKLTLDQAIEIAYNQSIFSFRQKNMYLARYWQFRSYKAEKLPLLGLSATPVNYQRSIVSRYNQETNEDEFVPTERLISDASVNVTQNITATGGKITASSDLQRIQNIESGNLSYYSTPITIGITQPLNGFNQFKWQSRIEPLKFEQAKREYLQSLQELGMRTTNSFFNVLKAEINFGIAETNLSNADTLYRIGKGRFEIGTVTQDELLDLELSYLNANMALSRAKIDLYQSRVSLNSFLGFEENVHIECIVPRKIPSFKINADYALDQAFTNNPDLLNYEQQLIEANREIARARTDNGINASIYGNYGYNKSSSVLDDVYRTPFGDEQNLRLSLSVPIVDWGLRRGKIQMARSEKEVTEAEVRQAKIDFEQDVFIRIMEFNMQEQQVKIAAKADTIALMGFEVTKQRFLIDKVDVIKLNAARNSLDAAKRNYIQSIQEYWYSYFNIRRLTLYNFEKNETLIHELDQLLQK
ncbi:TolC family protein [Labilibacter sediminis]|nr:TolC family protein [Labilibacter sediminis]